MVVLAVVAVAVVPAVVLVAVAASPLAVVVVSPAAAAVASPAVAAAVVSAGAVVAVAAAASRGVVAAVVVAVSPAVEAVAVVATKRLRRMVDEYDDNNEQGAYQCYRYRNCWRCLERKIKGVEERLVALPGSWVLLNMVLKNGYGLWRLWKGQILSAASGGFGKLCFYLCRHLSVFLCLLISVSFGLHNTSKLSASGSGLASLYHC